MKSVYVGSDHAGYGLKEFMKPYIAGFGYEVVDSGCFSEESCDYPNFAHNVCKNVRNNAENLGILICGTGIGMSMAANRFKGIRAALCSNEYQARMSKAHNDANVLCLGSRVIGQDLALSIIQVWLESEFEGGRHQRRVDLIESL
jgi:ribose 5-phosphate isomerase B